LALRAALAAAVLALAGPAIALEISPAIQLAETYTSNVNLGSGEPGDPEESEWITSIVPSLRLGHDGNGLDVELDYALQALLYAEESDRNEVFHRLGARTLLDVIGEELQLSARAGVTQVNVSPDEEVTNNNLNTTGNRSNAVSWEAGPQWRTVLFGQTVLDGFARAGARYYDDEARGTDGDDVALSGAEDLDTLEGRVSLRTAEDATARVSYDLGYEFDRLDYEDTGEVEQQSASLRLGYRLTEGFQVFGAGRLESDFEDGNDSSLSEFGWEAGFTASSALTRLEASGGQRYFGTTWRLALSRTGEDSTYRISYSETPNTSDRSLRQRALEQAGDGPVGEEPDDGIDRFGSPRRFLQKRASATATWRLSRSSFSLRGFWDQREDQREFNAESPTPVDIDDEESFGGSARFSINLGERTTAGLAAAWRRREVMREVTPGETESNDDDLTSLNLNVDYRLGERTSLGFSSSWQQRDGAADDTIATGSGEYDEFQASVRLARSF
jgi:hypothetical protein